MKFRLMLKQAVRDFVNKWQLYLSFFVFIMVSIGLIVGLFSFNFNIQEDYQALFDVSTPYNAYLRTYRFASINAEYSDSLKNDNDANRYQVEDGKFTKYVFDNVFLPSFDIDAEAHQLRGLTTTEITALFNDQGLDANGVPLTDENEIRNNYFDDNVVNFIGRSSGYVAASRLATYQKTLGLNDTEIAALFDESGQIVDDDLSGNLNALRYIAFYKASWYGRSDFRWFSSDSDNEFYDRNEGYNSNLLTKYLLTQKITRQGNRDYVAGTNTQIIVGRGPNSLISWIPVQGKNGVIMTESLMPGQLWMQQYFDLNDETVDDFGTKKWEHLPEIVMQNRVNTLKVYDQLNPNRIDETILKSGNYGYVNPLFLKTQGLKLGDKINYYSTTYDEPSRSITIIGTANAKTQIFNNSEKTTVYLPFQTLKQKRSYEYTVSDISLPKFGTNFLETNDFLKETFYQDFQELLIPDSSYNNFSPRLVEDYDLEVSARTLFFFNLLAYLLGLLTLLLLFSVFYFITEQSIKLQRQTLRFLKSMGESNFELGLITSVSSLLPILLGAGLGIVTSFGVSQILVSVTLNTFPFYFAPFIINRWAWFIFVLVLAAIILMFLGLNILIISGSILKLGQNSKPGLMTRGYMAIKPMFKRLNSKTRIGISFIAKNVLKNLLTFILLTIAFGVVLFSVQFKSSAVSSARSFENRYTPYRSVLLNAQNTSDSIRFDLNYIDNFFPDFRKVWEDPELKPIIDPIKTILNHQTYYQGSKTTYLDQQGNFVDAETGEQVTLKPIETNEQGTGDENFNGLIKNQLNEALKVVESLANQQVPAPMDPEYDLKQYYLTGEYAADLLQNGTSRDRAKAILNFTDQEFDDFARRIQTMIRDFERNYQITVFNGTDEELLTQTKLIFENIRDGAINDLEQQLDFLKISAVQIKSNFPEFDYKVNLYFNRSILPSNRSQQTLLSTKMTYNGWQVSALGLDERSPKTFRMISNPLPILKPNDDGFETIYTYRESANKTINVRAMDVYVSGNFADQFNLRRDQILKVSANSFGYEEAVTPTVYLHIVGIVREASFLREIYFNKTDIFNYLKVNLEDENPDGLNSRADYQFLNTSLEKLAQPVGVDLFNNTVFSYANLPYGFSQFGLVGNLGSGYSLLSYTNLPVFRYESQNYPVNLADGVYVFGMVTQGLLKTIFPISGALDRFLVILLLITLAVCMILITLILFENKNIILLFKSLGYLKHEVNNYLTVGYIISALLAIILGVVIAYFGLRIASRFVVRDMGISLFFVWSPTFISFSILLVLSFIAMTLISVSIYTDLQKPRNAFSDL